MQVTKHEVKNFKNISEFSGDFISGVYLITGENDRGKSNLIESIMMAFTGDRRDNLLKQGTEKGFVKTTITGADNQEYLVSFSFSENNPRGTIKIEDIKSGLSTDRKSFLDQIFGYNDFDAIEFIRWSDTAEGRRKQVEAVKKLMSTEVVREIGQLSAEISALKEERRQDGIILRNQEGTLKTQKKPTFYDKLLKQGKRSVSELGRLLREAIDHNRDRERQIEANDHLKLRIDNFPNHEDEKGRKDALVERITELKEELFTKSNELKMLDKTLDTRFAILEEGQKAKEALVKPEKDAEAIQTQIDEAAEWNEKVDDAETYQKAEMVKARLEKRIEKANKAIDKKGDMTAELINKSDLPIKGLTFTDDELILNGLPFRSDLVSTSEGIKIATMLIIASNPEVKVFRIMNGESLGEDKLQAIIDFANKNGYQGFVEELRRGQDDLRVAEISETE